ncbi:Right handed beta helix region [Plantibacter sp. VKM Ac-1784]|uniref:Right handed beta helix region n=1 Tax=Plantibacter elymi (nom. nud.) TaxID=199708 RepID=A0ABY1R9X5_9MICO|nr:Right handed beta helix region [Plantibacter sp. VKM Ac-1784]
MLGGPGIDTTGAVVSTAAVKAWFAALPDGATAVVRGGDVVALDGTLRLARRIDIRGGGELRFVAGLAADSAIKLIVDGSSVRDVRVTYSGPIDGGAAERNVGIDIHADDVVVDGVTVDGFQNGIVVRPFGEYQGTIVTNCHVLNIRGAGGGSGSDSKAGEDRGDGIAVWGARATVVGNVVSAAAGTDARIGIHAESLGDFAVDPGSWLDSMITISGNVVSGPFRRGITLEGVGHAVVSANTVSDATWWGISLNDTGPTSVVGNAVRWTRTADQTPGSVWNPLRCPIMLYRGAQSSLVTANVIEILGVASAAIVLQPATLPSDKTKLVGATDAIISDNIVRIAGGSCSTGVAVDRAVRATVSGNQIAVSLATGPVGGVISYLAVDAVVSGNSIVGAASSNGYGVLHQGDGSIVVMGNRIDRIRVAVAVNNCTGGATIVGNTGRDCEYGLDTFGTTGPSVVQGNRWESNNTAHANAQPNTSYLSTRHMGLARPYGGRSGDILVGNGLLWVNDQGTWRWTALK